MKLKSIAGIAALLALSGCWNGDSGVRIHLGDVSIGQQMIDLKRALDEGAVSAEEYESLKQELMNLGAMCRSEARSESAG